MTRSSALLLPHSQCDGEDPHPRLAAMCLQPGRLQVLKTDYFDGSTEPDPLIPTDQLAVRDSQTEVREFVVSQIDEIASITLLKQDRTDASNAPLSHAPVVDDVVPEKAQITEVVRLQLIGLESPRHRDLRSMMCVPPGEHSDYELLREPCVNVPAHRHLAEKSLCAVQSRDARNEGEPLNLLVDESNALVVAGHPNSAQGLRGYRP